MANYINVTLDTTGPSNPTLAIEGGAMYASAALVNCTISTSDSDKTGYQIKIWGDVDLAWGKANGVINAGASTTLEADAIWITYVSTKQIQMTTGDGTKTLYLKIRDDVYNTSSQVSDTIILDTTLPIVTITGPDVPKVSKVAGKNVASFSFQSDSHFTEYKVKVVASTGTAQDAGTVIGIANGSTNMAATGSFTASTPINCTVNGADLETASSGDGVKIIKVFVKDDSGLWSA